MPSLPSAPQRLIGGVEDANAASLAWNSILEERGDSPASPSMVTTTSISAVAVPASPTLAHDCCGASASRMCRPQHTPDSPSAAGLNLGPPPWLVPSGASSFSRHLGAVGYTASATRTMCTAGRRRSSAAPQSTATGPRTARQKLLPKPPKEAERRPDAPCPSRPPRR